MFNATFWNILHLFCFLQELKSKGGIEALKEDVNDHGETLEDPLQSLGLDKTDEQTVCLMNLKKKNR